MPKVTGDKIEGIDYDALALEVNRIYSDTSNGSGGPATLTYSTSDLALTKTNILGTIGEVHVLGIDITDDNYITVTVDYPLAPGGREHFTLDPADYTVDTTANTITVNIALTAGGTIRVWDRYRHIFGWGQEPLSVYPHPTFPTDDIEISKVLEANINNLIDKTNIMTERVGSSVEITRIAVGNKIYPNFTSTKGDINTIADVISGQVLASNANWNNEVATIIENVTTVTRTDPWQNQLQVAFRWTFDSYNDARYFFNAGGQCRVSLELTGDVSDTGYLNWAQVARNMGAVSMNWTTTEQTGTGGISEGHGFYDLTDVYQTLFTSAGPTAPYDVDGSGPGEYGEYGDPADYVGMNVLIEGRYFEDSGLHGVDIRITLDDNDGTFTNAALQDIDGTTTFNAGYKIGDDITNNSATFTTNITPPITVIDQVNDDGTDPDFPADD